MIFSASTLFLATLVLTTSVFSAPIRLPVTTSDVVARADSVVPQLVAKAAVVDVQPLHKRSGLGLFSRRSTRLLTEREPLPETPEVPVARDIVEEPEVRRRYPRRVYQEYYEKREPQPELVDVPAPVVQKREESPRAYPRRALYERYEKRAPSPEPATKIKETTTMAVTKVSTFDSPEDLAAGNINPNGSVGTTESTISLSETQTIPAPGSAATATGVVNVVTGTVTSATASATASASSTANPSVATVTGSATSTAGGSAVTVTGSATPVAEAATPSVVVSSTSSSAAPAATVTSNPGTTAGRDGTQPPDGLSRPSGGTSSLTPVARDVQGKTTESLIRRSAYSGATWASFVRRQSN